MKNKFFPIVLGLFFVLSANPIRVFAEDFCQTDNNSVGIPNSCYSSPSDNWILHDCSANCHEGKSVCNQAQWIKPDPNMGGCGYLIQPACYCTGN